MIALQPHLTALSPQIVLINRVSTEPLQEFYINVDLRVFGDDWRPAETTRRNRHI